MLDDEHKRKKWNEDNPDQEIKKNQKNFCHAIYRINSIGFILYFTPKIYSLHSPPINFIFSIIDSYNCSRF